MSRHLSHVQVRGDIANLKFYQRQETLPDNFELGIAPHRAVRDHRARRMPGGAKLLTLIIKDVFNFRDKFQEVEEIEKIVLSNIQQPAFYEGQQVARRFSKSITSNVTQLLFTPRDPAIAAADCSLNHSLTLTVEGQSLTLSVDNMSASIIDQLKLMLQFPTSRACDVALLASSLDIDEIEPGDFTFELCPMTGSRSHRQNFQVTTSDGKNAIEGVEYRLFLNGEDLGVLSGNISLAIQNESGKPSASKSPTGKPFVFLDSYHHVLPSPQSDTSHLLTRRVSHAFWKVKEFGKHSNPVYRLEEAQGYFDTDQLPPNGESVPIQFKKTQLDDEQKFRPVVRSLCFIDLNIDYANSENCGEWLQDLQRLQPSSASENGVAVAIGIVGRATPQFHYSINGYRVLFSEYVKNSFKLNCGIQDENERVSEAEIEWNDDTEEMRWCPKVKDVQYEIFATLGESVYTVNSETQNAERQLIQFDIAMAHSLEFSLWEYLHTFFRRQTVVVVSAQTLRGHGVRISHRISWERTAQDCLAGLQTQPLRRLSEFGQMIIRVGVTGAVHVFKQEKQSLAVNLHYDPVGRAEGGGDAYYRDSKNDGIVLGSNCVFCGAILASFLERAQATTREPPGQVLPVLNAYGVEAVGDGIDEAIRYSQSMYEAGYGDVCDPKWGFGKDVDCCDPGLTETDIAGFSYPLASEIFPGASNKTVGISPILMNPRWSLLEESARSGVYPIACKIAVHGLDQALNQNPDDHVTWPAIIAPRVKFGKLDSIEREEIEALRNIDMMIRSYRTQQPVGDTGKPLSFAVFGPPGSGKSFGVRQVIESLFAEEGDEDGVEFVTCNLAQLSTVEDLTSYLFKVSDVSNKFPVLFVDEFDSALQQESLGWLRYFLAIMEDGEFKHEKQMQHLPPSIMVFAGGTSHTFQDFEGKSSASSEQERLDFIKAKGPDFVSRLSGHINMMGINPRDEFDARFMIRRAIQLRHLLKERKLVGPTATSMVAPAFLETLLRIPLYKHGSRSMRIVLDMCLGRNGMVRLPTLSQLDMHVDAEQLLELYEQAQRNPTIRRDNGLVIDHGRF